MGDMSGGKIIASYATGDVASTSMLQSRAGGLVGYMNRKSGITASYATGDVTGTSLLQSRAGGLVGELSDSSITASYATGDVIAISATPFVSTVYAYAGGLVGGTGLSGSIIASYYDTSAVLTSLTIVGGKTTVNTFRGEPLTNTWGAQTRSAMQTPTDGSGIYAKWVQLELDDGAPVGIDDRTQAGDSAYDLIWDFGTSKQYPVLKIDFDADAAAAKKATVAEFGPQRALSWQETYSAPGMPTGLMATAESRTQINLQWVAPTDTGEAAITGYQIRSAPGGNMSAFTDLHMVTDLATLTYQHTGLTMGTEYHYQVAAINSVGTGDYTNPISATTLYMPTVSFSSATYTASEDSRMLEILLETPTALVASVRVPIEVLVAGTTAQPTDYTLPTPSMVIFGVGDTAKTFVITLSDDNLYEGDEVLRLSITATDRLTVGTVSVSVLTIIDNEMGDEFDEIGDEMGELSSSVHRGDLSISLYPNPVVSALRVRSFAVGRLLVYDFTGTLLGTYALSAGVNSLSFSEYDQGVYALQVLLPSGESLHRIVKE